MGMAGACLANTLGMILFDIFPLRIGFHINDYSWSYKILFISNIKRIKPKIISKIILFESRCCFCELNF